MRFLTVRLLACAAALLILPTLARAENEGQAELDQATELKLNANTLDDLERVVRLCETALRKGLDENNQGFAKQLLTSALYTQAEKLSALVLDAERQHPQAAVIRQVAMKSLEKALTHDANFGSAHLLLARLHADGGGDRERGLTAANEAIRLFEKDKEQLSKAYLARAELGEAAEEKSADFQRAIDANPENLDAWRERSAYLLESGQLEKALEAYEVLLAKDPEDIRVLHGLSEAHAMLKQFDRAIERLSRAIELKPDDPLSFTLRARAHALKDDLKSALEDLDKAVKVDPRNLPAILMRARLRQAQDDFKGAREDVNRALVIAPGLIQAILLRSLIAAAEEKYDDAIADMELLLREDPKNVEWRLQMAAFQNAGKRPRKAIRIYEEVLGDDPENFDAMRGRADALLGVGKHKEAIETYETLFKKEPEDSGVLNNFAWVLATSTVDELRDGKRAVELALKACELTEYKRPHILSTLAAAYAEAGDLPSAIKWSTKAVELGQKDIQEQLEKELQSYKDGKPFRELQDIQERPEAKPNQGGGDFEL